jgi:hypothetical protein
MNFSTQGGTMVVNLISTHSKKTEDRVY